MDKSARSANTAKLSKVANHVPQFDAKGFRDSQEGVNRNGPIRTLDLAYVNRMQIRLFREKFLRHPAFLTELADILANSFVCLKAGHSRYRSSFTAGTP